MSKTIRYIVETDGFDWDSDHYIEDTYGQAFITYEDAKRYYDQMRAIEPDEEEPGHPISRPVKYVQWREDPELSSLTDIHHGGIFPKTTRMIKETLERIELIPLEK